MYDGFTGSVGNTDTGSGRFVYRPKATAEPPPQFAAIVGDWDGTFKRSYKKFRVVGVLETAIANHHSPAAAQAFVSELSSSHGAQKILHRRKPTVEFFNYFTQTNGINIPPSEMEHITAEVQKFQKKAYEIDSGLWPLRELIERQGTILPIYTNTGSVNLFQGMRKGSVNPAIFGPTFANGNNAPMFESNPLGTAWKEASAFSERLIEYKGIKKPSTLPVEAISRAYDIPPEQILVLGEGGNDAAIVFHQESKYHFAFHQWGAADIDKREQVINEKIRPGAEPLGEQAVYQKLQELRAPQNRVIRLPNGVIDIVTKHNLGEIKLIAPPRRPTFAEVRAEFHNLLN